MSERGECLLRYEYRPAQGVHGSPVIEGGLVVFPNLFDALDEAGEQAWEAVGPLESTEATSDRAAFYTILMKRRLSDYPPGDPQ